MEQPICKDVEFLTAPCEPGTAEDTQIVQDLLDTLEANSEECVGFAANQIGQQKRIAVYQDDNGGTHVLFNPKLLTATQAYKVTEACLCLDDETKVTRYGRIKVSYDELVDGKLMPRKKQFNGWTAQVVQHLIDHCNGKLV